MPSPMVLDRRPLVVGQRVVVVPSPWFEWKTHSGLTRFVELKKRK